ncbi:hypothetical protein [Actinoplanes sp. HUAS TT8]|uniref:hypothetical protein n=1 Tax=Actinoplanes sp. HUAS TT8 TaxID=3447453 RepID=UPI003F51F11C
MTDSWHGLLLALAGVAPDTDLAAARAALAGPDGHPHGDDGALAALEVLHSVPAIGSVLTTADLAAAAVLAGRQGPAAAATALSTVGLKASDHTWQPLGPRGDLTGTDHPDPIVQHLRTQPGVLGVWGALRGPSEDPVFLVEVAADPAAVRIPDSADPAPVEVFRSGTQLPDYHRAALGGAALLWAAETTAPELVPVFDGVDEAGGPRFDPDHPMLDEAERAGVAAYLDQADPVLLTTATMADVVEPSRGEVVPLTYRTDGRFVWPDAAAYYAREHGLAPFGPLLAAIRSADYRPPATPTVTRFRAEATLFSR